MLSLQALERSIKLLEEAGFHKFAAWTKEYMENEKKNGRINECEPKPVMLKTEIS